MAGWAAMHSGEEGSERSERTWLKKSKPMQENLEINLDKVMNCLLKGGDFGDHHK